MHYLCTIYAPFMHHLYHLYTILPFMLLFDPFDTLCIGKLEQDDNLNGNENLINSDQNLNNYDNSNQASNQHSQSSNQHLQNQDDSRPTTPIDWIHTAKETSQEHLTDELFEQLRLELNDDFNFSQRQAIVDYILKDPQERKRLKIKQIPIEFQTPCIRAPVPWHSVIKPARNSLVNKLHRSNPVMQGLQNLFFKEFHDTRFIRIDDLKVPCAAEMLSAQIVTHCREALEHLEENWIPAASSLLRENKHLWQNLVPTRDNDVKSIKAFFETVSTLMSIQLRYIIENSVNDFVKYVTVCQIG